MTDYTEDDIDRIMEHQHEKLHERRAAIAAELDEIDAKLARIDAYRTAGQARSPRRGATPRGRRSGKREELLAKIREHPQGITRGELLDLMQLKGDKSGEQSVSNALSALKRQGVLVQEGGKYTVA